MQIKKYERIMIICSFLIIILSGIIMANSETMNIQIPDLKEAIWDKDIHVNEKSIIDASNLAEGYISIKYTGGKDTAIKVQITKKDSITYTYNLNNLGYAEIFPISDDDGEYIIQIYEKNDNSGKYAVIQSVSLKVKLRNALLPFMYPNQFVSFSVDSQMSKTASNIVSKFDNELDRIGAIYDFVINNFTYDYELAKTVQSGYAPNVDFVFEAKKGICFDYASVMTAMLRSQEIPARLEIGYTGTSYHAWISVYIEHTGWIDNVIYFNGFEWNLMDPTFASTGNSNSFVMEYISNAENYITKYVY